MRGDWDRCAIAHGLLRRNLRPTWMSSSLTPSIQTLNKYTIRAAPPESTSTATFVQEGPCDHSPSRPNNHAVAAAGSVANAMRARGARPEARGWRREARSAAAYRSNEQIDHKTEGIDRSGE